MDHLETALAFVVGALSPAERAEVARRRLYDGALDQAILNEERRLADLDQMPPAEKCADGLWGRISGAMAIEQEAFAHARPEAFGDGQWEVHNDKIDKKLLWSDKAMLLRCNPGAIEDDHDQDADEDEHILVVAGDVMMGGRTFSTGDTIHVEAGSLHRVMTTRDGCILLSQYVPKAVN